MNKFAKIYDLEDEDGYKFPRNVSTQFREVQGGIEHLKIAAEVITEELKGVNNKLGKNTTDVSLITNKVNSIDSSLKKHMKQTAKSLDNLQDMNNALLNIMRDIFTEIKEQSTRINDLEKINNKESR